MSRRDTPTSPPRLAEAVLSKLLPDEDRDAVIGELRELHQIECARKGTAAGGRWYVRQVIGFAWRIARHGRRSAKRIAGDTRGKGGWEMGMGSWIRDLRIAARSLGRRPGFALGVVVTLGLGIGATTTIYAIVDGVILRPLPYEDSSSLVAVGSVSPANEWLDQDASLQDLGQISWQNYQGLRDRARSFEALAAIDEEVVMVLSEGVGRERFAPVEAVSSELFEMLGTAPVAGRTFLSEEYSVASEAVAMITYEAWQRRYGGDPGVVGRTLGERNFRPVTVVGVLPPGFYPLEGFRTPRDFYFPLFRDPSRYEDSETLVYLLGRLSPGVSVEQARAETDLIAAELATEFPEANLFPDGSHIGIGLNGLHAEIVGTTGRALGLFLGAAGLLLLLAAMNAATMLLARALDRTREFGLRMALGAGRGRVVRLLVSEAGILAAVGGALGVLLAYGGVGAFLRYVPSSLSIPRLSAVAVDGRVLAVAAVVSFGTGIVVGLLPALRLTRHGPWGRLQRTGGSVAEPTSRLRTMLVGGQMTVAMVLLSGAGLLFNSFMRNTTVDPGIEPDGLVTMFAGLSGYEPLWQGWDVLLDELRSIPGVVSAAGTSSLPFRSARWAPGLLLPGQGSDTWHEGIAGYAITPGYLETMGTELLQGRDFERLDGSDAQRVALVNESFVRTHLGGADPIGATVRLSDPIDAAFYPVEPDREIRIVGVVEDVVQRRAEDGFRPAIYVPYTQYVPLRQLQAVVRTTLGTDVIVSDLRRAAAWFNPSTSIQNFPTMRDYMTTTRTNPLFQTMLTGAFAIVATLLAAVGLYGSLAHFVGRRQRELGIRMALGADRAGVLRMVLGQGMRLSLVGLAFGLIATILSTRVLAGFLYGVEPNDPMTLLTVGAVMLVVSAAACLAPALRATAVDPVRVLRAE